MDFITLAAEDKIKKAIKDGELDNLEGMGKPLKLEDLSGIPENLRMAYKIMKNAGMLTETDVKKELMTIDHLISSASNEKEKRELTAKRMIKEQELEKLFKKRNAFSSPASSFYKEKAKHALLGK
ncbi:DUF1992 domain-containing protein [Bacillus sp. FJAT-42376]|uniref:DnaJ family domain-containing protein n=1 Tax=Bacillus sp. FJAT-42376 TaxID=2014076 RepID=UPI000F4E6114|nr:DUF1992 domain-containing protein [Bacillus sp. FJAT-42376]AZB41657.1 DUF1992 domain-containing protein [Bacillus sp. FJAT-42376]